VLIALTKPPEDNDNSPLRFLHNSYLSLLHRRLEFHQNVDVASEEIKKTMECFEQLKIVSETVDCLFKVSK